MKTELSAPSFAVPAGNSKIAHITRICGCRETRRISPGKGGNWYSPSRRKFARHIACSACPACAVTMMISMPLTRHF